MTNSKHILTLLLTLLTMLGLGFANTAHSQGASRGDLPQSTGANFHESDSALGLNPEAARRLSNFIYSTEAMNRTGLKKVATKEELMAHAKELIAVLKLSCTPLDVELAGVSSETVDGKLYQNSLYEVSCTEGIGYFLNSHDHLKKEGAKPDRPSAMTSVAITCFSAERIHDEDIQKTGSSEFYCHLADNGGGDIRGVTEKLLATAGANCKVSQSKWFGAKPASKTEFTEAVCDSGAGYLLQTALPGGDAKPSAMNCTDAVRNGLECKLTKVAKPVTLATFKEYLEKTDINCKINDYDQISLLGRESTKQRYVVEFKCAQQPNGLVAFIPLDGNANPFETVDCKGIKKFGSTCKLTKN